MSDYTVRIKVDELIKITNLLLQDLKERGHSQIDLKESYYWDVVKDERYNPQEDPTNLTLGDLVHDWERMEQIIEDPEMIVSRALVWLGSIYRGIGEELSY